MYHVKKTITYVSPLSLYAHLKKKNVKVPHKGAFTLMKSCKCALITNMNGYLAIHSVIRYLRTIENKS